MKVIGFIPMKKQDGKVVFTTEARKGVTGEACDNVYLYGDIAKKVTDASIGKEILVQYGRGYSGKAFVQDVTIK